MFFCKWYDTLTDCNKATGAGCCGTNTIITSSVCADGLFPLHTITWTGVFTHTYHTHTYTGRDLLVYLPSEDKHVQCVSDSLKDVYGVCVCACVCVYTQK